VINRKEREEKGHGLEDLQSGGIRTTLSKSFQTPQLQHQKILVKNYLQFIIYLYIREEIFNFIS